MQGGELQAALKALQLPLGGLREVKRQRLAAAYALRAAGAAAVVEDSLLLKRIGLARFDPVAGAGRARQTPRGAALKRRAEMAIANGRALRHGGLMQAWKPPSSADVAELRVRQRGLEDAAVRAAEEAAVDEEAAELAHTMEAHGQEA